MKWSKSDVYAIEENSFMQIMNNQKDNMGEGLQKNGLLRYNI